MTTTNKYFLIILIALCSVIAVDAIADNLNEGTTQIARFSEKNLNDWENKSFEGETQYSINQESNEEEQNFYLQAISNQSASALYKKIKVDVNKTPYLNWSWRVDQALPTLSEKTKTGDDYAARIYVVFKTGFTPLSAKALNYVWSSNDKIGTHWSNAYTEKAIMIPLRCKLDETSTWYQEKINIKKDLIKHFGKIPNFIDGVAIMTDTDNSKGMASASYGDIYFSQK